MSNTLCLLHLFWILRENYKTTQMMHLPFVMYQVQIHRHTECAPKATHILEKTEPNLHPSP